MGIDFLIIGGGAAGMAAAIQTARLGLSTTIVEKDRLGGQANAAPWIENYPGFPEGITGRELMASFKLQTERFSVPVVYAEVISVSPFPLPSPLPPLKHWRTGEGEGGGDILFTAQTPIGMLNARCLLLAVGLTPKLAGVAGEIPYGDPDRIEHAGKDVLVIGGGDSAFDLAWSFAKRAGSVTVGMRSEKPRALPKLVDRAITSGVVIKTNWSLSDISYDIIVSCIGKEAKNPLLEKLQAKPVRPEPVEGRMGGIPGVYFAGDICHANDRHIAIAVGDGIAAAQAAYRYIKQK